MRIGFGRDIHRFEDEGRDLILGGIKIPYSKKVSAHSDGDVVFHALAEAILGALALGDLGTHFNESDPNCLNMDSSIIVNRVLEMMNEKNYHIENVDISIVLEKPKLRPYIDEIRRSIASVLKIDIDLVSFKAQTNESVDAVGLQKAVDCYCAILLEKN